MNKRLALLTLLLLAAGTSLSATQEQFTSAHLNTLFQQGIAQELILGVDENGVPRVCGTGIQNAASLISGGTNFTSNLLPAGMYSWECIPNVIRNDGIDTFRLEVDANRPVYNVRWLNISSYPIVAESGTNHLYLRDDGLGGDRVAGDYIYTSEKCRYRVDVTFPPTQNYSTNTPAGIYFQQVGQLFVDDTEFLIPPSFAILNTNVPPVETVMLASNIQVSAHLINLVTTNRDVQRVLRVGGSLTALTQRIYSVLPDAFDCLPFFTTDHIEYSNQLTSANFVAGKYLPVSRNFTGTGTSVFDNTSFYGSGGRLMGIPMFDIMERGIQYSVNATHELSHHWSAEVTTTLNITTGDGHYHRDCSIHSILGGQYYPVTNTSGGIIRECITFANYPEATPLDKYMMGLISTSAVPALHVSSNILAIACGAVITNMRPMVTISNIVAAHGVRTPDPASSKKDFRIGFATGSHNRLLNATELTFYDLLAAHFTKSLPPNYAPPNLGDGWVPITKFFGEGTTWNSDVLGLIRPTITNVQWMTTGFRVDGTGYPGRNYRLLGTTNLVSWTQVTNKVAGTNGSFALQDGSQPRPTARWYKVATP